jgi:NAD+ kinase
MRFNRVALVGKADIIDIEVHLLALAAHLSQIGVAVYVDMYSLSTHEIQQKLASIGTDLNTINIGKLADFVKEIDLVIVIGGDGTLLSVGRQVVDYGVAVVGINRGKLGFMTDIAIDEMVATIDGVILKDSYTVEPRTLFTAEVIRGDLGVVFRSVALNDVVISRGSIGNMIEFDISINDQFVLSQKSDGVIFSTPTGSTAYSLAAGGPILHPQANVFSIIPICSQSLSNRPLVVNDDAIIKLLLVRDNSTQIHFDGQECFDLAYHDQVLLHKHNKTLNFIHPKGYNYYRTLRKKLDWSKRVS